MVAANYFDVWRDWKHIPAISDSNIAAQYSGRRRQFRPPPGLTPLGLYVLWEYSVLALWAYGLLSNPRPYTTSMMVMG